MAQEAKINPEAEQKLTVYQKMLLNEFQNKPEVMQLLKVIFNDYPQVILVEHITSKSQLKRKQRKSIECAQLRMKMEAFIEEKIARLAGIDVDKIASIQKEVDEKEKAATEPLQVAKDVATTEVKGESNG